MASNASLSVATRQAMTSQGSLAAYQFSDIKSLTQRVASVAARYDAETLTFHKVDLESDADAERFCYETSAEISGAGDYKHENARGDVKRAHKLFVELTTDPETIKGQAESSTALSKTKSAVPSERVGTVSIGGIIDAVERRSEHRAFMRPFWIHKEGQVTIFDEPLGEVGTVTFDDGEESKLYAKLTVTADCSELNAEETVRMDKH